MDCSLPGSSVHGIFQARVLEWSAIAFSGYMSLDIVKTILSTTPHLEPTHSVMVLHVGLFGTNQDFQEREVYFITSYIRASKKAVYFSLPDSSFELVVDKLEGSLSPRMQPKWSAKQSKKKKKTLNSGKAFISENI